MLSTKLIALIQLVHLVVAQIDFDYQPEVPLKYENVTAANLTLNGTQNITSMNLTNQTAQNNSAKNHTPVPTHIPKVHHGVPTAVFHGLNDNCSLNAEMVRIIANETKAHAECIEVGSGRRSTWWRSLGSQAAEACAVLQKNKVFGKAKEFNVIGFSQGGLIARYIVEECELPGNVRNLVAVGTPNMGESAVPYCEIAEGSSNGIIGYLEEQFYKIACIIGNYIASCIDLLPLIQEIMSPPDYFRMPGQITEYFKYNNFLPYLNNEIIHPKYKHYRQQILKLNTFVMIEWDRDQVLYPRETAMFSQLAKDVESIPSGKDIQRPSVDDFDSDYTRKNITLVRGKASANLINKMQYLYQKFGKTTPNEPTQDYTDDLFGIIHEDYKLVPLEKTEWFKKDYLGLKTLEDEQRVLKLHLEGGHDEFSMGDVRKTFVPALML